MKYGKYGYYYVGYGEHDGVPFAFHIRDKIFSEKLIKSLFQYLDRFGAAVIIPSYDDFSLIDDAVVLRVITPALSKTDKQVKTKEFLVTVYEDDGTDIIDSFISKNHVLNGVYPASIEDLLTRPKWIEKANTVLKRKLYAKNLDVEVWNPLIVRFEGHLKNTYDDFRVVGFNLGHVFYNNGLTYLLSGDRVKISMWRRLDDNIGQNFLINLKKLLVEFPGYEVRGVKTSEFLFGVDRLYVENEVSGVHVSVRVGKTIGSMVFDEHGLSFRALEFSRKNVEKVVDDALRFADSVGVNVEKITIKGDSVVLKNHMGVASVGRSYAFVNSFMGESDIVSMDNDEVALHISAALSGML